MTIFDVLTLIGGLCLFLFGMNVMGQALERRAGSKLQSLLAKLTSNKFVGLLTGLGVTAVIQSSSATTVMVVGFVNSGLMSLTQAINVIMGANIGTTVTAWILSLGGISGDNLFVQLLKPMAFTPVLALIGIILYMFTNDDKKKDTGTIFLGFAVLMFGMDAMTNAVAGLANIPSFTELFLLFENPILGVLVGAILTAIVQSSSASVGILQALAATGAVSYGAAIPIIMGQNIGTCITAILSSFGTNRNAKRAALVHLAFNVIGTLVWLSVFSLVNMIFAPAIFGESTTLAGIAIVHSAFNIACTLLLLPMSALLEKIAYALVPETKTADKYVELDERLLLTPALALERCHLLVIEISEKVTESIKKSINLLVTYNEEDHKYISETEELVDHYEDIIGKYLIKISTTQVSDEDSLKSAMLLKIISDYERISDHATNILKLAISMHDNNIKISGPALNELNNLKAATNEVLDLTAKAFIDEDLDVAKHVEPLEEIIDELKLLMRDNHIKRLQQGLCEIETGFIWSDILTDIERVSDHCSNIAGCIINTKEEDFNAHSSLKYLKESSANFKLQFDLYADKYLNK